jgi:hypothetical protein
MRMRGACVDADLTWLKALLLLCKRLVELLIKLYGADTADGGSRNALRLAWCQ